MRGLLVALLVTLVSAACSTTVSDEAIEDVLARCEDVPQATLDYIAVGLTIDNGVLSNGSAVKSDYGETLWVVAAQVNGDGFDGGRYVGIWAMVDGIEESEIRGIAAVDDFSREISTWGEDLGREISSLIDGVSAAQACVIAEQAG